MVHGIVAVLQVIVAALQVTVAALQVIVRVLQVTDAVFLDDRVLCVRSWERCCTSRVGRCSMALHWCRASWQCADFARATLKIVAPLLQLIGALAAPRRIVGVPHRVVGAPHRVPGAPHLIAPTPDLSASTPNLSAPTPDLSGPTPDLSALTPDVTASRPDRSAPAPRRIARAPRRTVPAPDCTIATPDRVTRPRPVRVAVESERRTACSCTLVITRAGGEGSTGSETITESRRAAKRSCGAVVRDPFTGWRVMPSIRESSACDTS